jgi:tRNA (guanine-N7-)-methyltransferase
MKPKDLKAPFDWENRQVLLHDRILYVPNYYKKYQEYEFPGWSHPDLFPNNLPIKIEYCSGNGMWITHRAQTDSKSNWVAVEMDFERVKKIWSKLKNWNLTNLLIACGEAFTTTHHYFPNNSVSEIFVNFPDPWPKRRHSKKRLFHKAFIQELKRIIQPDGIITIVTDDIDYSERIISIFLKESELISCYPLPHYVTEIEGYGSSFFEELWRRKGKTIRYHRFKKV